MLAYRLGELPDVDRERSKEQESLPEGPRISLSEAMRFCLPDGTLFCAASNEQIIQWFEWLFERADVSLGVLIDTLTGIDLSDFDARWYALNEILEVSSVRDAYMGKSQLLTYRHHGNVLTRDTLDDVVQSYGLRVAVSRKADGTSQVFARRTTSSRIKVYLCVLSALEKEHVTEEYVREKLEKRGLSIIAKQQKRVA